MMNKLYGTETIEMPIERSKTGEGYDDGGEVSDSNDRRATYFPE